MSKNVQEANYPPGLVTFQLARLEPERFLPVYELRGFPGLLSFPKSVGSVGSTRLRRSDDLPH